MKYIILLLCPLIYCITLKFIFEISQIIIDKSSLPDASNYPLLKISKQLTFPNYIISFYYYQF